MQSPQKGIYFSLQSDLAGFEEDDRREHGRTCWKGQHTAVKEEKKVRRREKGEFFGIQVLMWALDNNDDGISSFFPPSSSSPLLLFCGD